MRKLLLLVTLLLSVTSYGQVATRSQWGVAKSTDSLNETRDGYLLGPGAGRYLKSLIDANTNALANKQATLVSGANIKTVGGVSLLGAGDIPLPNNYVLASASPYAPVSTTPGSATINDGLSPVFGIPVFVRTRAEIQALINSYPATLINRFVFFGDYSFPEANVPLVLNKNIELVSYSRARFLGGTTNGFLVKINNMTRHFLMENISLISYANQSDYGLMLVNAEGAGVRNATWRGVDFKCPNGNYNAFSSDNWDGNSQVIHQNWRFENCKADSVSRMWFELRAHKHSGLPTHVGTQFINCSGQNIGLYNAKNDNSVHPYAASISGDHYDVTFSNFRAINVGLGIELVNARKVKVDNPYITGVMSTTNSNNEVHGAVGISITDGYQTEQGNANKQPYDVTISGGYINVSGRPIHAYRADTVKIDGTFMRGGEYLSFQHGRRLTIRNVEAFNSGTHFIANLEDQQNFLITNSTFSREGANAHPIYQPLTSDGSSTGRWSNIEILTNKNIVNNGIVGAPDNVYDNSRIYEKQFIVADNAAVFWTDVRLNGVRLPDSDNRLIPTSTVTAAGSQAMLKFTERVVFNPPANSPIASYSLTLPPAVFDAQTVELVFGGNITSGTVVSSLSLTAADGNPVLQALPLSNVLAGSVVQYRYVSAVGRWFEARLAPKGNYVEVASYDAMTKQLPVKAVTTFYLTNDEVRNPGNPSEYRVWPSGAIMWQASQKVN